MKFALQYKMCVTMKEAKKLQVLAAIMALWSSAYFIRLQKNSQHFASVMKRIAEGQNFERLNKRRPVSPFCKHDRIDLTVISKCCKYLLVTAQSQHAALVITQPFCQLFIVAGNFVELIRLCSELCLFLFSSFLSLFSVSIFL